MNRRSFLLTAPLVSAAAPAKEVPVISLGGVSVSLHEPEEMVLGRLRDMGYKVNNIGEGTFLIREQTSDHSYLDLGTVFFRNGVVTKVDRPWRDSSASDTVSFVTQIIEALRQHVPTNGRVPATILLNESSIPNFKSSSVTLRFDGYQVEIQLTDSTQGEERDLSVTVQESACYCKY